MFHPLFSDYEICLCACLSASFCLRLPLFVSVCLFLCVYVLSPSSLWAYYFVLQVFILICVSLQLVLSHSVLECLSACLPARLSVSVYGSYGRARLLSLRTLLFVSFLSCLIAWVLSNNLPVCSSVRLSADCLSVSMFVSIPLRLCLSLSLSVCLSPSPYRAHVFLISFVFLYSRARVCVCVSVSVCVCACVCVCV